MEKALLGYRLLPFLVYSSYMKLCPSILVERLFRRILIIFIFEKTIDCDG